MPEPESDGRTDHRATPEEWAAWALLGDPYLRLPMPLKDLARRIAQAVRQAAAAGLPPDAGAG